MPDPSNEQELAYESILPQVDAPVSPNDPQTKGYEYYAQKAAEATGAEAQTPEDTASPEESPAGQAPEVPAKFQGKSEAEIIESYLALEKEFGRRGNELGQLRRINDELLELREPAKGTPSAPERKKVEVDSLLDNPDEVINDAVDNNPRLRKLEQSLEQDRISKEKAAFESAHPNWNEQLTSDANFQQWITGNPIVAQSLVKANDDYDYVTIKQVYDMYAQTHGTKVEQAEQARNAGARQSVKEQVQEGRGSQEQRKPGFKRSEIIELRLKHPQLYEAKKAEIMEAYANKRVINDL